MCSDCATLTRTACVRRLALSRPQLEFARIQLASTTPPHRDFRLMLWPLAARSLAVPLFLAVGFCGAARQGARSAERWQHVELRVNTSLLQRVRKAINPPTGVCMRGARTHALRAESRSGAMQVSVCSGAGACMRSASATAWVARQVRVLQRRLAGMDDVVCELTEQLAALTEPWRSQAGSAVELGVRRGHVSEATAAEDPHDCAICWEEMRRAATLHCGHSFCRGCIRKWSCESDRCPCCREPIRHWASDIDEVLHFTTHVIVGLSAVSFVVGNFYDEAAGVAMRTIGFHLAIVLLVLGVLLDYCNPMA